MENNTDDMLVNDVINEVIVIQSADDYFMSDELYDKTRNYMNEILPPHLYLSGMQPTFNKDYLNSNRIKAILTVADSIEPSFPLDFQYKIINIDDDPEHDIA